MINISIGTGKDVSAFMTYDQIWETFCSEYKGTAYGYLAEDYRPHETNPNTIHIWFKDGSEMDYTVSVNSKSTVTKMPDTKDYYLVEEQTIKTKRLVPKREILNEFCRKHTCSTCPLRLPKNGLPYCDDPMVYDCRTLVQGSEKAIDWLIKTGNVEVRDE